MNAFFVISVVLLLKYFQNFQTKYLIFSGISGGAAFLAKSQAVFLIPFIFLISGLSFLILKNKLSNSIKTILIWLLTFFATIYILFPAMWATPIKTFWKIFDEGLTVASEGRNSNYGNNDNLYYFESLVWVNNIVLVISALFGMLYFFYKSKLIYQSNKYLFFSYLSIFLLLIFYFTQMTLVVQKSNRYLSILIPFIALFSGYIFSQLKFKFKYLYLSLLIPSIIYISYFSPYYLALFETQNWGSLAKETANYLNTKNKPENLNVIVSPKDHVFRPFFKGKIYTPKETIPNDKKADYVIIGSIEVLPKNYTYCIFEKDIEFRGKLFWKIYNCQ
jgi:4-amino-4-deoxy-L-arabinose transferase-like glycosyltransferase